MSLVSPRQLTFLSAVSIGLHTLSRGRYFVCVKNRAVALETEIVFDCLVQHPLIWIGFSYHFFRRLLMTCAHFSDCWLLEGWLFISARFEINQINEPINNWSRASITLSSQSINSQEHIRFIAFVRLRNDWSSLNWLSLNDWSILNDWSTASVHFQLKKSFPVEEMNELVEIST